MSQNILITGAAGFIGGSLLAELVSRQNGPIKTLNISAVVRSEEQAQALAKLDVNVIQADLEDEESMSEVILRNEIDIVVHTASSRFPAMASYMIKALGQRRQVSGKETYFIHSSVSTIFSEEGGWPYGEVRDTDPIFAKEKEIARGHPVRDTEILIVEEAKAQGVTSFILAVPTTYGRGTGEWRKLSVNMPAYIRTSIAQKAVYKFEADGHPPATHISDLVAFYVLLIEKILQKEPIPSGEQGYYFVTAHKAPWWAVMQRVAEALYARGLVDEPQTRVWPSYDVAADTLGFPRMFMKAIGTSSGDLVAVNAYRLGWQPKWDEERFLNSVDDEIQSVLDLDTIKPSLFVDPASTS